MATIQVIEQGFHNYIIKVDGLGGDTNVVVVDPALLTPKCTRVRLMKIIFEVNSGALAELFWDATTPVSIVKGIPNNDNMLEFYDFGGIPNNGGAGVTGKITLTTTAANPYTIFIYCRKMDAFVN